MSQLVKYLLSNREDRSLDPGASANVRASGHLTGGEE